MDDTRTQETLDALADLFLTGVAPARPTPVRIPPAARQRDDDDEADTDAPAERPHHDDEPNTQPQQAGDATANAGNAAGDDADELTAPTAPAITITATAPAARSPVTQAPVGNAAPAPAPAAAPVPGSPAMQSAAWSQAVREQLDGPESFRLHQRRRPADADSNTTDVAGPLPFRAESTREPANDGDAHRSRRLPPAHVEAVFIGNLPGFGGPWLTQYAHSLAQQHGPVAILHVDDDRIDADLVSAQPYAAPGADNAPAALADTSAAPNDASADMLLVRLAALATTGDAPVRRWLVHLPAPTEPRQIERARAMQRWTILSGADAAAIAGAQRLLQQLLDADAPADAMSPVGLVVMGADATAAQAAADRFNTDADLPRPIALAGHRRQMEPVHRRVLGGAANPQLWPRVHEFLNQLLNTQSETEMYDAQAAVMDPPAATEPIDQSPRTPAPDRPAEPAAQQPAAPQPSVDVTTEPAPQPRAAEHTPPPHVAATFAAPPQPATTAAAATPSPTDATPTAPAPAAPALAQLLADAMPGAVPLQARCPRQPDTELMLDEQGRLHLLRRHREPDMGAAVLALLEARDWAHEHLELLQLTQRQCRFDPAAEPTLHLFTADARAAVCAAARTGHALKLHLLQHVQLTNDATWLCTDLN